jgi:fructoselysine-6-P-deglycase FrlB-like protein
MLSAEYIFQEMMEQERIAELHSTLPPPEWPGDLERIIVTGSGDSYCAALFGGWLLGEGRKIEALPAMDGSRAARTLGPRDLLIGISVSGYTVRVIEAATRALYNGAHVIAVTDNLRSPLAKLATTVWPIHASPAEELFSTTYRNEDARQYVGYHHDVAQTKTFWAVILTLMRAARVAIDWPRLLDHTRRLLASAFFEPLLAKAEHWSQSGQTLFLATGWAKILARFAAYKLYEFNRFASFAEIEEYCHTLYFVTRSGDTIVFLVDDDETAARGAEIVSVLVDLFAARIIWLQPESLSPPIIPGATPERLEVLMLPFCEGSIQQGLDLLLALEWITYTIGRVGAPDINVFHAGFDTERLVAGSLLTIRRSAIKAPSPTD